MCVGHVLPLPTSPSPLSAYLAEGFLHLQNRVAQALVDWKAQQENITVQRVHVSVKQIPHPPYRIDEFLDWNAAILPLLLVMTFIYSAGMFTKVQGHSLLIYRSFITFYDMKPFMTGPDQPVVPGQHYFELSSVGNTQNVFGTHQVYNTKLSQILEELYRML